MSAIVAFLRARLDEDETLDRGHPPDGDCGECGCVGTARWLREVEAKRRFLAWATEGAGDYYMQCLLALPYSDHPDYDPAWR
ncbi:MAG TPA: DUF6221 family protein [Streptosporangiaceae bacterium]